LSGVALKAETLHRNLERVFRIIARVDDRENDGADHLLHSLRIFLDHPAASGKAGKRRVLENVGKAQEPLHSRLHGQIRSQQCGGK
jgi:hypothetical protein